MTARLPDITATCVFHKEGPFAIAALSSFAKMVAAARSAGLSIETIAVMDRPDEATRAIVRKFSAHLGHIEEVSFGDLGMARNAGVAVSRGRFLAFFDGDDLWCADWLVRAYALASNDNDAIWHPEYLYYFDETDFDLHSVTDVPHPKARSLFLHQKSTETPNFKRQALFLNNLWSANVFASRDIHLKFPYRPVEREAGFGIEDWSWNILTVWSDIPHKIVPKTVHLIRVKQAGSLGVQNVADGLLPVIPDVALTGRS